MAPLRIYGWHVAFRSVDEKQRSVVQVGVVKDYRDTLPKNKEKQKGAGNKREWGVEINGVGDLRFIDAETLAQALKLASEVGLDTNPSKIPTQCK